MTSFRTIQARAEMRKGGAKALAALLPAVPGNAALADAPDDRILAEMTKRIFSSGFVWRVIEQKWPGFEEAFLGFDVARLCFQPDEFWERLASDARIVRNPQKIKAVRENARFVTEVSKEHASFAKLLAGWSKDDQVGLLEMLSKRGSRLGGKTGQYFLRFIGWDGFVASDDVVLCLRDAGLDIAEEPTSRKDMRKVQDQMSAWARESGLPMTHVSRICAMSIGENYDADRLMRGDEGA
ncbi:MAG: DNA-3-methyladenine glycosylase I [Hyphomicrobiaceae bacterium]|nr:DNA-3-methyladenine glycosylase I [Hyphomicrobiaceae bacterium]